MASQGYLELGLGPMSTNKTPHVIAKLLAKHLAHGRDPTKNRVWKVVFVNSTVDERTDLTRSSDSDSDVAYSTKNPLMQGRKLPFPSFKVATLLELDDKIQEFDVIGIDELQFFPDADEMIRKWVGQDRKIVYAVGLSGSYAQKPLGQCHLLISFADRWYQIEGECSICSAEFQTVATAPFTARKSADDSEVKSGVQDYVTVCRRHHKLIESLKN